MADPKVSIGARLGSAWSAAREGLRSLAPSAKAVALTVMAVASILGRWALRLLIVLVLIAPLAFIAVSLLGGDWKPPPREAVTMLWFALTFSFAGAAWIALVAVHRAFFALVRSSHMGQTLAPRLLSGLAVLLFFPRLPRAALVGWFWATTQLGLVIPASIGRLATNGAKDLMQALDGANAQAAPLPSPESGSAEMSSVLVGLITHFFESVDQALSAFGAQWTERMPLSDTITAIALWAVLAIVICRLMAEKLPARLVTAIAERPSINLQNTGFVVILTAGTFLSLAAITALPRLRQTNQPNSEVTPQQLHQVLVGLQTPKDRIDRYLSDDLKRDPLITAAETKVASAPASGEPPAPAASSAAPNAPPKPSPPVVHASLKGTPPRAKSTAETPVPPPVPIAPDASPKSPEQERKESVVARFEEERADLESSFQTLLKRGTSMGAEILSAESQALSVAVNAYNLKNLDRHGSHEEIEHFLDVQNWFGAQVSFNQQQIRSCTDLIRQTQASLDHWMEGLRRARAAASDPTKSLMDVFNAEPNTSGIYEQLYDVHGSCSIPAFSPVPDAPRLGNSLGMFEFVAGWLLNVYSIPLTLIVGMLGFGLLGSVISTFVKERVQANVKGLLPGKKSVIVSDLAGVVLRGFSAAIVVFLAVQGGLAVLSGSSNDPNPYVLLLACFVAAVFSERVWQSAYDYLTTRLDQFDNDDAPTPEKPIEPPPLDKPPAAPETSA